MNTSTRIYRVSGADHPARLVRATHKAHALTFVAKDTFVVSVATQDDLVDLLGDGVAIENSAAEKPEPNE